MSAMLKLGAQTGHKKIFIWYDFKQVRDAVLIQLFSEKTNRFERIFIYASSSRWEVDVLRDYLDEKTYEAVCTKLQYLFEIRKTPPNIETTDIEKAFENHSKFLAGK